LLNEFTGGLVALGIGVHRWSTETCIEKFNEICRSGFKVNFLASIPVIGPVAGWLHGSIYDTTRLEEALETAFSDNRFFGRCPSVAQDKNPSQLPIWPRVAVTATVDTECKLFANYNTGAVTVGDYLYSSLDTRTM
jgi:hypothetical protein